MTIDDFNADSDWQVYRYVSRDMNDDEAMAFEQRLADDLALCEAVAEMQLLCDAVVAVETPPATPRRSQRLSRAGALWMTVAAVAVLAVTVWLNGPIEPQSGEMSHGVASTSDAVRVLSAWSSLQDVDTESDVSTCDEEQLNLGPEQVAVPDWMLAAVVIESVDEPEGLPAEMNERQGADAL